MSVPETFHAKWEEAEVASPHLARPVTVIAAKGIPYVPDGNRLQNLSLYLPRTSETSSLIGLPATALPAPGASSSFPRYHVYIHGGGWREPLVDAGTIEATVAHTFHAFDRSSPITAVASLNYTLSPFPAHPTKPYDAVADHRSDPAREAVHPQHVSDIFQGLALLRSFGLEDHSYILSGHSCGATLAFQAALQPPRSYGLEDVPEAPCPAAAIGLNGVYDLPALGHGSAGSRELLSNAFGPDERKWSAASPALFDPVQIAERVQKGKAPRLVLVDQSQDDQVVPMNQRERLEANLRKVSGLRVVLGNRCTGNHSEPWQHGFMIWASIRDAIQALRQER